MMINLKALTLYGFNGSIIFSNATCSFDNDQLNFIIGKSGIGKSSLLAFLSGIPFKTSGEVYFGDLKRLFQTQNELIQHRRSVAYIPQQLNLFNHFSVDQNIKFYFSQTRTPFDKTLYDALMEKLTLHTKKDMLVSELSIGQQQRVAILRALMMKTPYILADEPTGNLDPKNSKLVIDIFDEFRKQFGTTVIIVSHNYVDIPIDAKVVEIKDETLIHH